VQGGNRASSVARLRFAGSRAARFLSGCVKRSERILRSLRGQLQNRLILPLIYPPFPVSGVRAPPVAGMAGYAARCWARYGVLLDRVSL